MVYDTERRYYVYAWYIVDGHDIFYIGKGTGNRYKCRKRENPYFMNIINAHECDCEILESGLTESEAFLQEKAYIAMFRFFKHRLVNVADGGNAPPKQYGEQSEEHRKRIGEALRAYQSKHPEIAMAKSEEMKSFLQTEEGKEFQRKSIKAKDNDEFRKRQSIVCREANNTPEYIERHSKIIRRMWQNEEYAEAHKGANNHRSQAVRQLDLDGNVIKEYDTITQASKETGVDISKISAVCKGKRKTTSGYRWEFINDKHIVLERENRYDPSKDKNAKAVLQFSKDGKLIKEYYSLNDACRQNNVDRSGILANISGRTKTAYGYVWKYKDGNTVPSLK